MSQAPTSPDETSRLCGGRSADLGGAQVFGLVRDELEDVEEVLCQTFRSRRNTFPLAFAHAVGAGGKRIRPALVLLSARAAGASTSRETIQLAAALEAIHLASLVQDDVVDHSATRRGAESVNRRWGNEVSILLADFIFSATLAQMCSYAPKEVIQLVAATVAQMAEAELEEMENRNNLDFREADYLRVVEGKTAALMSVCCAAGAIAGGADANVSALLGRFGAKMGTAFQLADDLLDFVGDPSKTGKPRGKDLLEGKVTLPLISSVSRWDGTGRRLLAQVLGAGDVEAAKLEAVIDLILKVGGVEYARARAREFADQASACLFSLPLSSSVEALRAAAYFAVEREA